MTAPSPFLSLWRQGRDQLDAAFAENFVITPMLQHGDARGKADASRPGSVTFLAGWQDPAINRHGDSPGHSSNMGQKAVSSEPHLIMSLEALPYRPSAPDVIVRASTGETFQVSAVKRDGYGRLIVELTNRRQPK